MTNGSDTLTDDILLYVFNFYLAEASKVDAWRTLVHVCRRWRNLVFGSPGHLNLRIVCTKETPVKEKLNVWPALPIVVFASGPVSTQEHTPIHNLIAALEHHDRVCQIELSSFTWDLQEELDKPFPELRVLKLHSDEFLYPFVYSGQPIEGTTHLQSLSLSNIPIPDLPNLLLSCTKLIELRITLTGMVIYDDLSPDKMVTALSALTRLQVLHLGPEINWRIQHLLLPTPIVLHSLIDFSFKGFIGYLDYFLALIDAPLLERLGIDIHTNPGPDQVTPFNTLQTLRFIGHVPEFKALKEAHIGFDSDESAVWIDFYSTQTPNVVLKLYVICNDPEQHFPFLAQFCRSPFLPLPTLEYLCIGGHNNSQQWPRDYTENTRWLEFLQPFASVSYLCLSKDFARCIARALEELDGETAKEVFPTLENVLVEEFQLYEPVNKAFSNFAAMRQSSDHPIVVSDWDRTGPNAGHVVNIKRKRRKR